MSDARTQDAIAEAIRRNHAMTTHTLIHAPSAPSTSSSSRRHASAKKIDRVRLRPVEAGMRIERPRLAPAPPVPPDQAARVQCIRALIAAGAYDDPRRLDAALDRMLDKILAED